MLYIAAAQKFFLFPFLFRGVLLGYDAVCAGVLDVPIDAPTGAPCVVLNGVRSVHAKVWRRGDIVVVLLFAPSEDISYDLACYKYKYVGSFLRGTASRLEASMVDIFH